MHRREFIKSAAALGLLTLSPLGAWAQSLGKAVVRFTGEPAPFDYAWLKGRARSLAGAAYVPDVDRLPVSLKKITWDQMQAIQFRDEHALWGGDRLAFQVKAFHLGRSNQFPVFLYEVANGQARKIAYDPAMFDYGKSGVNGDALPNDLGFAGFRLNFDTDLKRDVAAFQGASYFRAVGAELQYGLSARGLAVDCGMDHPEEFPRFTSFWFERPAAGAGTITVYALMDSPSVSGAYRFNIAPGATTVMDVDAALYPRKAIARLGVAPLTSMFLCGPNDRRVGDDWRPQIHDSDGLAMWRGSGEWIWRPLTNPAGLRVNTHLDENPRGFGLVQRDRNFDHYQDDGVFYDKRPSVWIEPKTGWGRGAVQLVEIPAENETFDNIVAFWNPEKPPQPGDELLFSYRMHWGSKLPYEPSLATAVQTWTGIGGVIGKDRTYFSWRFVVDFAGGTLPMLGRDATVESVVTASRGEVEVVSARPLVSINGYRAMFDVKLVDDGNAPVDLRLYLASDKMPLSETWLYQWTPPVNRPKYEIDRDTA